MGTSRPEIEVVREQPASSEESKSIVNIAGSGQVSSTQQVNQVVQGYKSEQTTARYNQ